MMVQDSVTNSELFLQLLGGVIQSPMDFTRSLLSFSLFSLPDMYKLTSSSLLATRNIRARISFHRLSVHVEYSVDPHCLSSKAGESALLR